MQNLRFLDRGMISDVERVRPVQVSPESGVQNLRFLDRGMISDVERARPVQVSPESGVQNLRFLDRALLRAVLGPVVWRGCRDRPRTW
ncbi:hypothetical protein [Microbacterium pumilum]|uniref:Uncharacterized protein n=1 Tax=Microbacterium pumilum TaxID=344165 RepID=A0ABN2S5M0_9MICO